MAKSSFCHSLPGNIGMLVLIFSPPVWADGDSADKPLVVTAGADFTVRSSLTTPVDSFWAQYPQFAAEEVPFMRWRLGLEQTGDWNVAAEFDFSQQFDGWTPNNLPLPNKYSYRTFPIEYHGLHRADLTYDFHPLVVSVGRDKVHWGSTTDSLIVSNQVPFLDRIELHFPLGDWALDDLIASPETRTGTNTTYSVTTYQVAHRVSWRRGNLEIGFTEEAILDRSSYDPQTGAVISSGAYSITDFLPFSSIHETDVKPFNSLMTLDAKWRRGPWTLAVEAGFDDFDASIFGIPDDPIPNIPAVIAEVRWNRDRWAWEASAGFTHYLWGNYDTTFGKSIYRIYLDNGVQELPLTSPYGPGATWGKLALHYHGRKLGFEGQGEIWTTIDGVDLYYPYADDTPTGKLLFHSRSHLFLTFDSRGFHVEAGPQLLYANGLLTEQLIVQVSTTVGTPAK